MITGRRQAFQEPKLEIWVHLMDLTSDDKHNMQLDPNYIPNPVVNDRLSSGFHIPITMNIAYGSESCHVIQHLIEILQLPSAP